MSLYVLTVEVVLRLQSKEEIHRSTFLSPEVDFAWDFLPWETDVSLEGAFV